MTKRLVKEHWERETCGTRYAESTDRRRYFAEIEAARYELEPHIPKLAKFETGRGQKVLEIGVGAGTDFVQWARAGAKAVGIDLTAAGARLARERLGLEDLQAPVLVADAEHLPFRSDAFDVVYSHGVLHHSPDTATAFEEAHRVLRPGGRGVFMIYHLHSWTTLLLWLRYGLLGRKPIVHPRRIVAEHLESPGTKVYSRREARALVNRFRHAQVQTVLGLGDLLTHKLSAKHQGRWSQLAVRLYPRPLIRALGDRFGINLWIEAEK